MSNSKLLLTIIYILAISTFSNKAFAWMGYDYENDAQIEIGEGNLVRTGSLIKIYDWSDSQYYWVTVKEFNSNSVRIELIVEDEETKKTRTFDMEKND